MDSVVKDFFVSYTSVDKAWATWIAYILEADGHTVTIQEWDFRPGSNFAVEMDKALKQCPRMIAVLSPAYLKAQFPTPEWTAVFASDPEGVKNALVPVMVEECQPAGLLSQVVQIRIQGKDEDTARKLVLEGVRRERNKPTTPPPFPGPSMTSSPPPTVGAPFPAAVRTSGGGPADRLRWQNPGSPITVSWHRDLDPMHGRQGQQGAAVVEVHMVFSGEDSRLQVSELSDLKDRLPDHGRRTGIFTQLEALESHSDATLARAAGGSWDNAKGLAVTRSGQRSAWAPLPRGSFGSVIDVEHLGGQVADMLDALTALDLPHGSLVVPAIGLDPATMISYGSATNPSNHVALGFDRADHIHVNPDEAVEYDAVVTRSADVAAELVARLIAQHRAVTGLR
ncbi:toll/interleukin-1 receptor domain-containing protein [Actinoplanes sp. CA-131856]